jgi:hypothetical protein
MFALPILQQKEYTKKERDISSPHGFADIRSLPLQSFWWMATSTEFSRTRLRISVLDKLDLALITIESMTDFIGQASRFGYGADYPLVYARDSAEALFYIKELDNLGYVKKEGSVAHMLAKGYQRLQEIQRAGRDSASAFVAMSFNPSRNKVYDGAIKVAVQRAGYNPVRIDRVQHANSIDDEIIGSIKRSRFMVVTLQIKGQASISRLA